jgi:hypothetical protein
VASDTAVLGIATSSSKGKLTVYRVIVRSAGDAVTVERLEEWQSTPHDEARSMADLVDALANSLDQKRRGAAEAIAVKRTESSQGRPTTAYDQKTRAEAAAMIAASLQGRPYFHYRTQQLGDGRELHEIASRQTGYPVQKEEREAVAAACTALAELLGAD